MRTAFFALAVGALAGCANGLARPSLPVVVTVGTGDCLPVNERTVRLAVRNTSSTRVAFATYGASGPPYKLYAGAHDLLDGETGSIWAPVLDEYVPPSHEVSLGPGDEAAFLIQPSAWPAAEDPGTFMVEIRDTRWQPHRSKQQALCPTGSSPNNSSKPTPLRGAA